MRAAFLVALLGGLASVARPAHAADPAIGDCLLAAEASLKLRSEHKLHLTRTQLLVCSAPSCPAEVRQECMRRIDEVNAAAPTIVLAVNNTAGKELVAVKVSVDGQVVADHLDGSALAIDPGAHEFTFEASGLPLLSETIVLHEGEKDRRETVVLGGGAAPSASPHDTGDQGPTSVSGSERPGEESGNGRRVLGLVTGGLGIAGIAVGSVFGALASSAWKKAQQECTSRTDCSPQAMSDRTSALTSATVSTVGFVAGGVLAVTGLTLFLTAPKGGSGGVGLKVAPNGFVVSGGF